MKKIVTFGELMLRLKSPGHERLFQSPLLEASFGGGEANVAVSLSRFGLHASFVTSLPADPVGEAALRALRTQGVDVSGVRRTAAGRTGIYFLETGADQRASNVVYDRAGSAISLAAPGDFDWPVLLAGADWFHLTGITPALSASAAETALAAVAAARAAGARVSLDLNFRKKLWNYGVAAPRMMARFAALADVLIANEEDIQLGLGIEAPGGGAGLDGPACEALARKTREAYPGIGIVAITLRESLSADRNGWSAALLGKDGFRRSRRYELCDIVDRVGGGDSFAAGLVYGLLELGSEEEALGFAVAASALKHTIPGDFNLVDRAEVERLAAGEGSGRVQR